MTVKDFIKQDVDIDVYDDVCEELGIAFCGPLEISKTGERRFKDALALPIEILSDRHGNPTVAVLKISERKDWEKALEAGKDFFESAAGYCAASDWDRWFIA